MTEKARVSFEKLRSELLEIEFELTTDVENAVTDANYVKTTLRVGQDEGRLQDETIAQKYGILYNTKFTKVFKKDSKKAPKFRGLYFKISPYHYISAESF